MKKPMKKPWKNIKLWDDNLESMLSSTIANLGNSYMNADESPKNKATLEAACRAVSDVYQLYDNDVPEDIIRRVRLTPPDVNPEKK